MGPCAVRVRVVTSEGELVDADLVTHPDFALVRERHTHKEVSLPVFTRLLLCRDVGAVGFEDLVQVTEDRREQVAADFGEHDLEIGVAVEHSAQHQLPHSPARLDIGEEVFARDRSPLRQFVIGEKRVQGERCRWMRPAQ